MRSGRKGKGERKRERFGPPKNFGVAPPMGHTIDKYSVTNHHGREEIQ